MAVYGHSGIHSHSVPFKNGTQADKTVKLQKVYSNAGYQNNERKCKDIKWWGKHFEKKATSSL